MRLQDLERPLRAALLRDSIRDALPSDILTFSHDADRPDSLEGRAYGRVLGSITHILESDGLTITNVAHPYSTLVGSKAWGDPLSMNQRAIISAAKKRLGWRGKRRNSLSRAYDELLQRVRPRALLTIGASEDLCRSARLRDIPLIEVLHAKGYAELPWGWGDRDSLALPTGVISFDSVSTRTFSVLDAAGTSVWEISDPWTARLQLEKGLTLPGRWGQVIESRGTLPQVVLVSLQWGYAGDHGAHTEFQSILENGLFPDSIISALTETEQTHYWLFRLHPAQRSGSKYRKHRKLLRQVAETYPNTDWEWASSVPLQVALAQTTHHVTMSSFSTYDAAAIGIPTLLLCPTLGPTGVNSRLFRDLIDLGIAEKRGLEKPELLAWLRAASRRIPPPVSARTEFTTEGFLGRFRIPS